MADEETWPYRVAVTVRVGPYRFGGADYIRASSADEAEEIMVANVTEAFDEHELDVATKPGTQVVSDAD